MHKYMEESKFSMQSTHSVIPIKYNRDWLMKKTSRAVVAQVQGRIQTDYTKEHK